MKSTVNPCGDRRHRQAGPVSGRDDRVPEHVNNRQARVLANSKHHSGGGALAARFVDHIQARNAQIGGLLFAGHRLRFSRLRLVGYEAADSYLMPEVPAKLNGTAA